MARIESELVTDAATGRMRPARRLAPPLPRAPEAAAAATHAGLLGLFMATMLIPASFNVAGLTIPPYRILLMIVILPLFLRFLQDREQPPNAVDVLMMAYIAWTGLAILANHGPGRIIFIGSTAVDQFGAYLVGRSLIRSVTDFRLFFRYFFWALAFLLPFALLELVTRIFPLHQIAGLIATPAGTSRGDVRMGLFRAHTVFPHPILFGLFCAIAVAPFYYLYRESFVRKWTALALVTAITLTSLSTAPIIGMALQYGAIAWERLTRWLPGRWVVLVVLGALVAAGIELAVPGGLVGLLVEDVAFSEVSARARFEILEYGSAEVLRNPVFGIGFNEWIRPWWRKSSMDNYYLVLSMRYGLPTLVFFLAAVILHMALVARSAGRGDGQDALRIGYLISLAALLVMIASVSLWGALPVFILTLIGAGSWFYAAPRPAGPRRRQPAAPAEDAGTTAEPGPPPPAVRRAPGRAGGPPRPRALRARPTAFPRTPRTELPR